MSANPRKLSYCYILKLVYFSLRNTAFFSDIHIAVAIASKRFGHMVTSRVSTTAVVSTLSSITFMPYVCRRPKSFLHELMQSSTQMSDISHTKSFIWPKRRDPHADQEVVLALSGPVQECQRVLYSALFCGVAEHEEVLNRDH